MRVLLLLLLVIPFLQGCETTVGGGGDGIKQLQQKKLAEIDQKEQSGEITAEQAAEERKTVNQAAEVMKESNQEAIDNAGSLTGTTTGTY